MPTFADDGATGPEMPLPDEPINSRFLSLPLAAREMLNIGGGLHFGHECRTH